MSGVLLSCSLIPDTTNMEIKTTLIDPLIEKAEAYGKTSLELLKFRFLDKTAAVSATLISRLLLGIILSFFAILLNIAIALWLGELLGKNYYGFLIVSAFYGLCGMILIFLQPPIKARINISIIKLLFNK